MSQPIGVPRLFGWLLIALALLALVFAVAPQQVPVTLYKSSLVAMAGVIGYWLDRSLFPYARPDELMRRAWPELPPLVEVSSQEAAAQDAEFIEGALWEPAGSHIVAAAAMLRRALVVAAAMLAMGLGA